MRSILALSLLSACGTFGGGSPYHEDLLPQEDRVRINLPVDSASAKDAETGEWARYYVLTRTVTEDVNGLITFVLGTVGYITTLEPQWSDTDSRQAVWGPYSDSGLDPVETGLWVTEEDDGSYSWAIFQLPKGGDMETEAIAIITGVVDAGSTREDASGVFQVDFTTASELDPGVALTGLFSVEYTYDPVGGNAVAGFEDYGYAIGAERINALYAYSQDVEGAGTMDLAWLDDVNATGVDEILAMRTRWESTGDGRSDAIVTGGDLGADAVYASECWAGDFVTSYWTDTIGLYETVGDVGACVYAEPELPTEASFSIAE
ncbi:MAG: hypothetical protein Q8P18_14365 [Pseudomonadota bacterium]|nr:hypothetical protein [Pseudomonadota bacterium]